MSDDRAPGGAPFDPAVERAARAAAERAELERRAKRGANWFVWIALVSAVNVGLTLAGSTWRLVDSLSLTDGLAHLSALLAEDPQVDTDTLGLWRLATVMLTVFVYCGFIWLSERAQKGAVWAFRIGIWVYAADTVLTLALQAWLDLVFHVWALIALWGGLQAARELRALDAADAAQPATLEFGRTEFEP